MALKIFEIDPTLGGVQGQIWDRVNGYKWWKEELEKNEGGIAKFAEGYKIFGFQREEGAWVYREWLPNAKQAFLIGEFNGWQNTTPLTSEGFGRWSVRLPDNADGSYFMPHKTQIKVRLESNDGSWHDRVPAWIKLAWQDHTTNLFNGVFWEPPPTERYTFKHPRPERPANLKIYEAHVGMGSIEPRVASYLEFAHTVLPRIKRLGYNCVQLMAIAEHAHYGCFGYHVTSFFAPASRSGTPEELMEMVDVAHGLGIVVLMDLVHAHCSSNSLDGIAQMDGTDHCYTHGGLKGYHSQWDSRIFHYTKYEVLRFLLSNVKWWMHEYQFDGFRFDGITSMLYHSHGIGKGYTGGYHEYFGPDADIESHIYLMLANDLIHSDVPSAITVGEDVSGMPTLCLPVEWGGFGFDYRLAMAIPDMFIKLLKEVGDDGWDMGHITHTLTNRRWKEKVVAYCESHDQAIVGDKTLAFWLMDAEMYTGMSLFQNPTPSMCIDRGLALHKMIRLLVLGLGGEAYLNFMGNEFGHPEWIDFPRAENGWSHHMCRRRWDLAEDDLLRYKFFQNFDELMQAAENRFGWLGSEHQYVVHKDAGDKVIAFERGDLYFIFNFHPCNSFSDYQVGMGFDEPMRCILDTDEGRFGGHQRLEYGHANPFPPLNGTHGRNHSVKLYLPSRTGQVLCRESLCQGGVKIWVEDSFLENVGGRASDLTLLLEVWKDGELADPLQFKFDAEGVITLGLNWDATFQIIDARGEILPCRVSKDDKYRIYFPGDYTVAHLGYLKNGRPAGKDEVVTKESKAKAAEPRAVVKAADRAGHGYVKPADPPVVAKAAKPPPAVVKAADPPAVVKRADPPPAVVKAADPPAVVKPADPPAAVKAADSSEVVKAADPRDMARCYSGLHFLSSEAVQGSVTAREALSDEGRIGAFKEAVALLGGGDLKTFASSWKNFGLQKKSSGGWSYREWLPFAKAVNLVGDFNSWDVNATPLKLDDAERLPGVWSASMPATAGFVKGQKYKLYVQPETGDPYYAMPSWATRHVYTEQTKLLDAVVWPIEGAAPKRLPVPRDPNERLYECHPGCVAREGKEPGFVEMTAFLPRIARNGYTAIVLMGVHECKEFSSMGQQPISLFSTTRLLGTPDELRALVTKAHELGLRVYLSIAHDGAACCEDGLGGQYFLTGADGFHAMTGARLYDTNQGEVLRYLLGSLAFWMDEFGIDGFRFQDVTGMLFQEQGRWVPSEAAALEEWLAAENRANELGILYCMMANSLVHDIEKGATTIAEERGMLPDVCTPVSKGGLGFDARQASRAPKLFHNFLNTRRDEEWSVKEMADEINKIRTSRPQDKIIGYAESVDECVVARRPLKVAFLSWETLHTIAAGGVAPHVTELAAALLRLGHEVHIFTRSTQAQTWEHTIWGVVYHEVCFGTNSDFVREIENMCGAFVGHLCHVEGKQGRFDIIHGHDWLVGPAIIQLKSMGKRCVFTMHSTETGRCGNVAYGGQSARIREIEGHACHAAERVIAVSGVLKEEVCSHYNVHGAKIEVVYNGIHADPIANMEWCDDWTGNTKRDKGFNVMDPMFLFVGRLAVQKGPDLLLEAIPMILQSRGDAKFVIVGDGHMMGSLKARADQLGIGHAVHFTGSVKSGTSHLKSLFKSCDAVVVPSRNEPFGIVVLEAWASGKPVVATTCGGPRDFVTPDREGYLVDPNPGSIAWGVCKICQNFDHARWMGIQAKEKALNQFNWSFIARQTEQIYYEQLNFHGAPKMRVPKLGLTLASHLLGPHQERMGVLEQNILVDRGLAMLKQMKLLASTLGTDGTLTWMGSEIGQIGSIDMPRPANGNEKAKALVKYSQAANTGLKWKHLEIFEMFLNRTSGAVQWLQDPTQEVLVADDEKKVLAFIRGGCVFVFNFHPANACDSYRLNPPKAVPIARELVIVLDTEDPRFGGSKTEILVPGSQAKVNSGALKVSLPPRGALVLAPADKVSAVSADKLLQAKTADDLLKA